MSDSDVAELLARGFSELSAHCSPPSNQAQTLMLSHLELLRYWNRTHNLTSLTDPAALVENLFLDSWLVSQLWPSNLEGLIDVGSGGGFPGLVLLAARPSAPALLFEKVEKKRAFLQFAIAKLGFSHAGVSPESFPPKKSKLVDQPCLFTSRATWAPSEWLATWRQQARPEDQVILQASQETLPPGAEAMFEVDLPFSKAKRKLARYGYAAA